MYPEQSVDQSFTTISRHHLDIPLYWQCWKLTSPTLTAVTDAVRSAAAEQLRRKGE
jgi:LysR family transcriptional regulator (chromosome initiation inhibitor)